MTMKNNSIHSPKARFCGIIDFDKTSRELGSHVSFTNDDLSHLSDLCEAQVKEAKVNASVRIMYNCAEYPKFDWKEVKRYRIEL